MHRTEEKTPHHASDCSAEHETRTLGEDFRCVDEGVEWQVFCRPGLVRPDITLLAEIGNRTPVAVFSRHDDHGKSEQAQCLPDVSSGDIFLEIVAGVGKHELVDLLPRAEIERQLDRAMGGNVDPFQNLLLRRTGNPSGCFCRRQDAGDDGSADAHQRAGRAQLPDNLAVLRVCCCREKLPMCSGDSDPCYSAQGSGGKVPALLLAEMEATGLGRGDHRVS